MTRPACSPGSKAEPRTGPAPPALRRLLSRFIAFAWLAPIAAGVGRDASAQLPRQVIYPELTPLPAPTPTAIPAPPSAPAVIATVEGRPITQRDWDRVADPYFAQLKATFGDRFSGELLKSAKFNVLDELIRREVVAVEAQRQKISVTEAETDSVLRQDPFFITNGKFDPAKFERFKKDPTSNYLQILPKLRETAAATKLDRTLRARFTPSRAAVRSEWARRTDRVRCKTLSLQVRDVSLEAEATDAECKAYYDAHPDEFTQNAQLRFRYYQLPLPAAGDPGRARAESLATSRGRRMADSLRAGTLADSAAGMTDTGLYEIPPHVVPGLESLDDLSAAVERAAADTTLRVLGPYTAPEGVIVGAIVERRRSRLSPMREVVREVRRRANMEKRRLDEQAGRRAHYDAHLADYRGPRASLTRLTLNDASIPIHAPSPEEIQRWYAVHGHTLFGRADTSKGWIPPLDDSLRAKVRRRLEQEDLTRRREAALGQLAAGLRTTRDPRSLARENGAVAETLTLAPWSGQDSLFFGVLRDSILARGVEQKGAVQGPRRLGRVWAVWRVDGADSSFVPSYQTMQSRVERDYLDERRKRDEAEGQAYFERHAADYTTPLRYKIDYVAVPIPPPDSVKVLDGELRAYYAKNKATFEVAEQIHLRQIFISTRDSTAVGVGRAKARADSLRAAAKDGADFADLARRFSDDRGTVASGGDLGWMTHGRYVQEVEQAAFALQPGEIGPVVKSRFGYHVIKLEEKKAAHTRTFDEARQDIRDQIARARADTTARRAAGALRRKLALTTNPGGVAAARGGIQSALPFAANEPVPGLGRLEGLSDDIAKLPLNQWASRVYRATGIYVVLRPTRRVPPGPSTFEEVKNRAVEDARTEKRREKFDRKVAEMRAMLASGATLDSVSAPYGGLADSGPFGQAPHFFPGLGFEPRAVDKAFELKPGEQSDTLQTLDGVAWIRLEERIPGDAKAFEPAAAQITEDMVSKNYKAWVEEKIRTMKVVVLRPDLREARTPASGQVTVRTSG